MLSKFKSFPLSVNISIIFLVVTITYGIVMIPFIMIPLLILAGAIVSVIRLLAFFVHGE